jgi:NADH dehydrogenase FAD-containing subunit
MLVPHANKRGGAKVTTCIQNRARPEARSRSENPRLHYQPDQFRRWQLDRGSSTTNRRSGANQCAHQRMINRRFLVVPPAVLGSGHADHACEQQATDFLCLLLEMANIRVQSAPRILPAFSSALSARAERSLRDLGVEVRTGAKVTGIDKDGVTIDGIHIPARTTFWAAGVAASPAAEWLGRAADRSGRVVVDGNLAVQDCVGVFAIGDTAASNGWAGASVPGLAPAAKQQGRYVANVIRAAIKGHSAPEDFQYCHYGNLATIGRLASVVELRWLRLWGAPAWWFWGLAHVLLLTGGRNRATVVLNWLWAYLTYRRGTRLITGNTMDA